MSQRFSFDKTNANKVFRVFLWSTASSVVALCIALLSTVNVPVEYAAFVPLINTVLYALKEWTTNQVQG